MKSSWLQGELFNLYLIAALSSLSMGFLMPITPLYFDSIGMSPSTLGLLFSVTFVAVAVGEFGWGWLADHIGMKAPIMAGLLLSAGCTFAITLTDDFSLLFLISFFRGAGSVAVFPLTRAYVGETVPAYKRATFMGLMALTFSIGRTLGPLLGGALGDVLDYTSVFYISSISYLLTAVFTLVRFRGEATEKRRLLLHNASHGGEAGVQGLGRSFMPLLAQGAVAAIFFTGMGVSIAFLPLFASEEIHLKATDVGLLYTVSGVVSMALLVPSGQLSDRVGRLPVMASGFLLSAAAMVGFSLADSLWMLLVFGVFSGAAFSVFGPASSARVSEVSPKGRQGTAMGLYGLCEDIGVIAGPTAGGLIWESASPRAAFWFAAAMCAPGLIGNIALKARPFSARVQRVSERAGTDITGS